MASSRSARYAKWLSIPLGLVISALLIWQASYAAFTGSTASRDNTWRMGTVSFSNEETVKLFDLEDLAPGARGTSSATDLAVEYTGSLPAEVTLLAENFEDSPHNLADYITLTVRVKSSHPYNWSGDVYQGTLSQLSRGENQLGGGVSAQIHPGVSAVLQFDYAVSADAPDVVQNEQVKLDIVAAAENN